MSLVGFQAQNHPQQPVDDGVDDRALPPWIFAKWQERFRFTVDVAASDANAKLTRYYTKANSGLEASWTGERVYCNPPFSGITPWVKKAWAEIHAPLIVMLLPANRTEQGWWHELVELKRDRGGYGLKIEFLKGRLKFLSPGETTIRPNNRPLFGCCLLIWEREP